MTQASVSKTVLIVGVIAAILISSGVSVAAVSVTGQQGPKGIQGIQGLQGPIGQQGPKGDTGQTGATGPQGTKGDKGDIGATGVTGPVGPAGNATRYFIEGWFNTSQTGDLVLNGGSYTENWKRINVPQLNLTDMPSVEVFVKSNNPTNVTIDGQPATINMWATYHALIGNPDGILYDNGCIYMYYRENTYSPITGDYKIVVIK